jgi:cellulose synthase/poly-beta-1,6-N-acetylglucosamine synthase-like glycosyltransferase
MYTYIGYPLLLWIADRFTRRNVDKATLSPQISIVMAVWNEEKNIARRLDNLLAQEYPAGNMEVIVVSDGSSDNTTQIVASYGNRNVRLVELERRAGKASALNQGIAAASGEIIVFADARQRFATDAVSRLVANLHDPQVGCVSGELVLLEDEQSQIQAEMGAYWNYEKWIRRTESRTGSVVGATGAIYAIRRSLYRSLPEDTLLDDVLTPLNIVQQGYRCTFDSSAVAYDNFSKDAKQEWRRKVRTLAGNWQLLSLQPSLLLPWSNPCWWRFMSHKIMRLIVPLALILLFCSGALLQGPVYRTATGLQCLLYAMALAGLFVPVLRTMRIISLCYFFLVMNAAALGGFWFWATGRSTTIWNKPLISCEK